MAPKYLHSLADENPDLQRQIGCVNGVFQIFNRHNIVGHYPHRAGSGSLLFNNQTPGAPIMEKHRVSTESSNESFSSWSPSSPFSYVNNQNVDLRDVVKDSMYREARGLSNKTVMKKKSNNLYYDEPRELLRSKSCQFSDSFLFSLSKDYPRFSYDGRETERLFIKTDSKTKVKELPRLSLDSKERAIRTLNSVSLVPIKPSDSKSNLSRNPKINAGAHADKDLSQIQTQTQTHPPSVVAKLMGLETFPVSKSLKSSDDCGPDSARSLLSPCWKNPDMKPISRVPVEAGPWKQRVLTSSTKIHTSVSTVYNDVDKRLENLEFAQSGKDLRALKQILEAMKAVEARKVERFDADEGFSDHNLEINKDIKAHESHIVIMKPAKLVVKGFTNNKDSCKPRKQWHKQNSESKPSSVRKKPSNFKKIDDQIKETQSLQQVNGGRVSDFSTPEKSTSLVKVGEPLTQEYPSPVSVLDDSVYMENSPSPVKRTPTTQKDDATPNSAEKVIKDRCEATNKIQSNTINREKLKKVEDLVQKLKRFNSNHNESHTDYIASLCDNTNPNDRYISEILLASGILLKDLESFELHSSGHPINPDLFFVLEHIKFRNLQKGKYRRKLIFDAVNELLVGKLVSGSKMMQNPRKLLREMCLEMEQLQVQKKKEDYDDLKRILWENLLKKSENWENFNGESLVIAVEVEQLIFRDLVNEVVMSEAYCF